MVNICTQVSTIYVFMENKLSILFGLKAPNPIVIFRGYCMSNVGLLYVGILSRRTHIGLRDFMSES